jgi:hypothetical protein
MGLRIIIYLLIPLRIKIESKNDGGWMKPPLPGLLSEAVFGEGKTNPWGREQVQKG